MAIAACFVFPREISRSVFWDFFDSIGPIPEVCSGGRTARHALILGWNRPWLLFGASPCSSIG
jgi:hypothetical protein